VGYPRYAPQIVDIVTMDDAMYDTFIRAMAYDPVIYGVPPFDGSAKAPTTDSDLAHWRGAARWNNDYYPRFWRDIWPILSRPNMYQYVMDFDPFAGGDPHDTADRGNLDQKVMSKAPYEGQDPQERARCAAARQFVYSVLRQPGQENLYTLPSGSNDPTYRLPGMPLLCGDNPLSNTVPSKFLRLTETMLFLLKQWADGKFVDEKAEDIPLERAGGRTSGRDLDRGVLANLLGGSFCPGGEATWIVRNPAIYSEPYRVKQSSGLVPGYLSQTDDFSVGLEPGDLTKRGGLPWQADFNECSTQPVDITYEGWNAIDPTTVGDPTATVQQTLYWWPAHRPMSVGGIPWSGTIPSESTGDLAMVTAWKNMGFVCDFQPDPVNGPNPRLVEGWNSNPPIKLESPQG
jgi:hypothetical protein